jgi:hypothetical protein
MITLTSEITFGILTKQELSGCRQHVKVLKVKTAAEHYRNPIPLTEGSETPYMC